MVHNAPTPVTTNPAVGVKVCGARRQSALPSHRSSLEDTTLICTLLGGTTFNALVGWCPPICPNARRCFETLFRVRRGRIRTPAAHLTIPTASPSASWS